MKTFSIKSLIGLGYALAGYLVKQGYLTPGSAAHYYGYAVAIVAFISHLLHAPEADKPANMPISKSGSLLSAFVVTLFLTLAVLPVIMGCSSAHKSTNTRHEIKKWDVVEKGVTVTTSNRTTVVQKPVALLTYHEVWFDVSKGGGSGLLSDPKASAIASGHTNQNALGGSSSLNVGSYQSDTSTNGIKALGDATGNIIGTVGKDILKNP